MNIIGIDEGTEDRTVYSVRRGFKHVCTIPEKLGHVTGLRVRGDRVTAETESGVEFIIPRR